MARGNAAGKGEREREIDREREGERERERDGLEYIERGRYHLSKVGSSLYLSL